VVSSAQENVAGQTVATGISSMPCKKAAAYDTAQRQAIQAIYSEEFSVRLRTHMGRIGEGPHALSWQGWEADTIVFRMRRELEGLSAETYGGVGGWCKHLFFGNIAYDGVANGPIRLNRIPLKHRDAASIANTIAHEVAHRAGLTHPHSSSDLDIAELEPPYVIGNIVEAIVREGPVKM